jgi:hypothetical protein
VKQGKDSERTTVTEHACTVAGLSPNAPLTGDPVLDALVVQGRVIPAANPDPIPPTPLREEHHGEISLSEQLLQDREDERY